MASEIGLYFKPRYKLQGIVVELLLRGQTKMRNELGKLTHQWTGRNLHTIFTWLNAMAFITLVPKINVPTIQNMLLLDAQK